MGLTGQNVATIKHAMKKVFRDNPNESFVNSGNLIPTYLESATASTDLGLIPTSGWTEVSTGPSLLFVRMNVETDGTLPGNLVLEVDESGGTTADYSVAATADFDAGAGYSEDESVMLFLPPGATVRFLNNADPNGNNQITYQRVFEL